MARMRRALVASLVFAAVACKGSKSSDAAVASTTCAEGAACSAEGQTCSPAPIGTGWAHALQCAHGKWQGIEIAPLPQPPASAAAATGPCTTDADCAVEDRTASDCCSHCSGEPMTVAARDAIRQACAGKSDSAHCGAHKNCPTPPKASCVNGNCAIAAPPGR